MRTTIRSLVLTVGFVISVGSFCMATYATSQATHDKTLLAGSGSTYWPQLV